MKIKRGHKLTKLEGKKVSVKTDITNSKESLGNILKTCLLLNGKIYKERINF
jgi:hypothetical protein